MERIDFERNYLRREQLALTFLSYCIAVMLWRIVIFVQEVSHGQGPRIVITGIHLHHFLFGILLLLTAGLIYRKTGKRRSCLRAVLAGVGLGLIFDEISLWFPLGPNGYWAVQNFLVTVGVGMVLFLRVFPLKKESPPEQAEPSIVPQPHVNPENPYFSVVIPAFNEENFLAKSLHALVNQTFKDFELIVVDNNSTDRTAQVAQSFGARVIHETRQGIGHARQRGFTEARGTVIATTDADTVVPPGWLSRIAEEFKKDQGLVAFGGLYTLYSGPITARLAVAYLSLPLWKVDKFFLRGWSLPGANMAVRASSFRQIGGFNTELKLCEDVDISQRLKHVGRVALDPTFLVSTSGRRFKNGLLRGLIIYRYRPDALARMLFKKHKSIRLPTIRTEQSRSRKLSFAPGVVSIVLLFSMFYASNPSIADAKPMTILVRDGTAISEQIKATGRALRNLLPGSRHSQDNPVNLGDGQNLD
ncbi:MAG TPA: glycosyltransferase [Dehalococcoidia bacterium]|nr:glycosyltransferase [Dehalococcoidia bacterium]